jgi:proton glutamate symport protein
MVVGALFGWLYPKVEPNVKAFCLNTLHFELGDVFVGIKVISNIFLKLIKCIIVPIIFGTLVVGIAGHSDDLKAVGRLALKSIIYFEIVTTLALAVGLIAVNLVKPGVGITLPPPDYREVPRQQTTAEMVEHIVPSSFFDSAARNDVLQVVVFALIFAVALTQVSGKPKETILNLCEGLSEVMFKFTGLVMRFAPFGIGAAMAVTVGHSGLGVLINLFKLVATLYGALFVFLLAVLLPVALIARIPVLRFLKAVKEPALIAFSTTSSDAALPDAFKKMIAFGVPKRIVSFVLPAGYSFNLDGSTLYLAVASIFVAQAAGKDLPLGQQLMIMLTLMLTTKGIAAVPRASIVVLTGTLVHFDLPLAGIILIMGVDELMDMARTTVNLVGNCLASAVMARSEGELKVPAEESPKAA